MVRIMSEGRTGSEVAVMEAETDGKIRPRVPPATAIEVTRQPKRKRIESVEELEVSLDRTAVEKMSSSVPSGSRCSSSVHMRTTSSGSRNVNVDLEANLAQIGKSAHEFLCPERQVKMRPQEEESAVRQSKVESDSTTLASEIEEFFTRTTKEQLKFFQNKYNFDFEKEEPLEGSYDWKRFV